VVGGRWWWRLNVNVADDLFEPLEEVADDDGLAWPEVGDALDLEGAEDRTVSLARPWCSSLGAGSGGARLSREGLQRQGDERLPLGHQSFVSRYGVASQR
jgi:hypothetical protein